MTRAGPSFDTIIVGQGLAGTTLAWQLINRGKRVLIVDAAEPVTSSKIAAGLMTPIAGMRLTLTAQAEMMFKLAEQFYRRIETATGRSFYHPRQAVRLFASERERLIWSERRLQPDVQPFIIDPSPEPLIDAKLADASGGGFVMRAAQLDVAAYLAASREADTPAMAHISMTLDWRSDVVFNATKVTVAGHQANRVIACEGAAARNNPYFDWVPFHPAKGDILTIRFHGDVPRQSLHHGVWIAPTAEPNVFKVGSTYDWRTLDQVPSTQARETIERKLQAFVRMPYTVIDHQAAVRPIIHQSSARVGLHRVHHRLGYFNGLGSKGALQAPWYAARFADFLVDGVPLPDDIDVQKSA